MQTRAIVHPCLTYLLHLHAANQCRRTVEKLVLAYASHQLKQPSPYRFCLPACRITEPFQSSVEVLQEVRRFSSSETRTPLYSDVMKMLCLVHYTQHQARLPCTKRLVSFRRHDSQCTKRRNDSRQRNLCPWGQSWHRVRKNDDIPMVLLQRAQSITSGPLWKPVTAWPINGKSTKSAVPRSILTDSRGLSCVNAPACTFNLCLQPRVSSP